MQCLELGGGGLGILDGRGEADLAQQFDATLRIRGQALLKFGLTLFVDEQAPHAPEKAVDPLHALGAPRLYHFQRPHEHLVEPEGVGPILDENIIRVDNVAARLGHFLAVLAENEPLVHQPEERFRARDMAQIEENLVPETGVEQMQHGVLRAADV